MSLTRDQLIQYVEKPGLLKEQTIAELKEIVDEFPYFQSAHLLYTCNLFTRDNFRYANYLKTCSLYATDRSVLYQLLKPFHPSEAVSSLPEVPETTHQETSSIFELSEETQIVETELQPFSQFQVSEAGNAGFDLLSFDQPELIYPLEETAAQAEQPGTKTDEKPDLIEQFIKVNPTIQPRIEISRAPAALSDPGEEEDFEKDDFITETLSRIYLKQGHYQKAIDAFKRLSLKFPEKSVYFAEQIEEIKKLLN